MVHRVYSVHGCATCKRRKKKCDESKPVCGACTRLDLPCQWRPTRAIAVTQLRLQQQPPAIIGHTSGLFLPNKDAIQLPLSPRLRQQADADELRWLDHFYSRTLPVISACQPQINWRLMLEFFMEVVPAFRAIAVAMSVQHRRLLSDDEKEVMIIEADSAYQRAVAAWRTTFDCWSVNSLQWIVAGCVLMMQLESMRGAAQGLEIHLAHAVTMVNHAKSNLTALGQISSFLGLLQALCTSILLYETSPTANIRDGETRTTIFKKFTLATAVGAAVSADDQQYTVQSLISKFVAMQANVGQQDIDDSRERRRPRERTRMLRTAVAAIRREVKESQLTEAQALSTAASVILLDVMTDFTKQGDGIIPGESRTPFQLILDLLQRCIARLKVMANTETLPFALGLDIVQKLELVLVRSNTRETRGHAYLLLQQNPMLEGPWSSGHVVKSLLARLERLDPWLDNTSLQTVDTSLDSSG